MRWCRRPDEEDDRGQAEECQNRQSEQRDKCHDGSMVRATEQCRQPDDSAQISDEHGSERE